VRNIGFMTSSPPSLAPSLSSMRGWYATPLGRALLQAEGELLEGVLPGLFGYHLVAVGCEHSAEALAASPIRHRILLCRVPPATVPGLCAEPDALPLASASVDVMVMQHILEFERRPHEVIREAYRVLIPEGRLVLTGFNPWSFWGLRRLLSRRSETVPWSGQFLSLNRIRDWLALLGFEIESAHHFFFRPPLQHRGMMARLGFLEGGGRRWWPALGGAYVVTARKRVIPLTPIKPRWRPRRSVLPTGLAEPTTRSLHRRGQNG
jgi:SAM-dependent methyltransferase